jgi:hypothetical protein
MSDTGTTEKVTVTLPKPLVKQLNEFAESDARTLSGTVRWLLMRALSEIAADRVAAQPRTADA